MKKFLLIFAVSALILSLIVVGVSAETPTNVTDTVWTLNESIDVSSSHTLYFNFSSNGQNFNRLEVVPTSSSVVYRFYSDSSPISVYSSSGGWVDPLYRVIYITGGSAVEDTYAIQYLTRIASQTDDSANLAAMGGVDSAISFGGSVLNFIASNSLVLALIGLSVGLFLIVPFAITKFKYLVKGY